MCPILNWNAGTYRAHHSLCALLKKLPLTPKVVLCCHCLPASKCLCSCRPWRLVASYNHCNQCLPFPPCKSMPLQLAACCDFLLHLLHAPLWLKALWMPLVVAPVQPPFLPAFLYCLFVLPPVVAASSLQLPAFSYCLLWLHAPCTNPVTAFHDFRPW